VVTFCDRKINLTPLIQMGENFVIPDETVISRIYLFRNQKVMLDKDLAEFYGIATKVLNQAVKRLLKLTRNGLVGETEIHYS